MTGIDAIHRERIWSMLRAHTSSGAAIVCAAPHLDEISSEVDRIVELVDGVARSRDGGGSVR